MRNILIEFVGELKPAFSKDIDFSDGGKLAKVSKKVYQKLDEFKIGPRALSLLVVFAFDEKKREKLWKEIEKAVRENR